MTTLNRTIKLPTSDYLLDNLLLTYESSVQTIYEIEYIVHVSLKIALVRRNQVTRIIKKKGRQVSDKTVNIQVSK